MAKKLKDADNYHELFMKRKDRLAKYKANVLSEKSKAALGFPSKIYQDWQAHWTLDDEPQAEPEPIIEAE